MTPTIFVMFDGVAQAKQSINALIKALSSRDLIARIGSQIALEGKQSVVALTPRQRNARERRGSTRRFGRPLFKGWQIEVDGSVANAVYAATIKNVAATTPAGTLVLGAVEHGAGRHDMYGVFGWFEGTNGIRARSAYLEGKRISLPGGRASSLESGKTTDIRFAIQREAGYVNVGRADAPGHIDHPGSPAHHMVTHTKQHLAGIVGNFEDKLMKEYQDAFNLRGSVT